MAASMTPIDFSMAKHVNTFTNLGAMPNRRRRIDRNAGRALEVLGHAIEYLTDEFVHEGGSLFSDRGELEAVQILMALNREVYYECPVVPSLGERVLSLLGVQTA